MQPILNGISTHFFVMHLYYYRIADAEENLGESEVREAHLAKSLFYIRISDRVCLVLLCNSHNF